MEELVRNEPDVVNKAKIKRIIQREPRYNKQLNPDTTVFIVNYHYENNYNHILTKLISLVSQMPNRLELLIVTLPPDATFVDSSLAEMFMRVMWTKHGQATQVLFIKYQDKLDILNQAGYTGCDSKYLNGLRVKSLALEPDSLLYSWGSAANGKLGISESYFQDFENDVFNKFYMEDNLDEIKDDSIFAELPSDLTF